MSTAELIEITLKVKNRPKNWRYGQAVFNYCYEMAPEETDKLRGTKFDCFYDDRKVNDFIYQIFCV